MFYHAGMRKQYYQIWHFPFTREMALSENSGQTIDLSAARANMLRTNLNQPEVWGLVDSDYTTTVAQELPEKAVVRFIRG